MRLIMCRSTVSKYKTLLLSSRWWAQQEPCVENIHCSVQLQSVFLFTINSFLYQIDARIMGLRGWRAGHASQYHSDQYLSDQLIMSLALLSREDFSQYLSHTLSLWSIFPPVCRLFVCCGRSWRTTEPLLCFFYLVKDKTEQTMSEKGRFSPLAQTFKIKDGIKSKGWVFLLPGHFAVVLEARCCQNSGVGDPEARSNSFFCSFRLLDCRTLTAPPPPPAESHTWGTLQSW